jgi:predicted MFS family arabinose efflux permease
MLIGPFLGDVFLWERERGNFASLFVVAAVVNVLPAIGLYFLRPTDSEGTKSSVRLAEFIAITRQHWPGMILLVDFAFGICMTSPFIFVASFIDRGALNIKGGSVIGLFFLCYAGLGIVVRFSSRRLPDRIGAAKVLLVGTFFMSVGMFCFGLVDAAHSWMIVVPAILTGTGHGLMFHTMTSLTLETFPSAVRGTGSALALMMLDLGTICGAPILGLVGEYFGFAALFGSIGIFCLGVSVTYVASRLHFAVVQSPTEIEHIET